jgi:hypothetical protein
MERLPRTFKKHRWDLMARPDIVIELHKWVPRVGEEEIRKLMEVPVSVPGPIWREVNGNGALLVPDPGMKSGRAVVVALCSTVQTVKGPFEDYTTIPFALHIKSVELPNGRSRLLLDLTDDVNRLFADLAVMLALYFAVPDSTPHVPVESGVTMKRRLGRVGDTFRYAPIESLSKRTSGRPCETPGASGIKKKDHAVRGHWRHYPNGNRVWVRSHRRGDPDLGTSTRVLH